MGNEVNGIVMHVAMDHMHRNGIFHRDIKPENILIIEEVLKVAHLYISHQFFLLKPCYILSIIINLITLYIYIYIYVNR